MMRFLGWFLALAVLLSGCAASPSATVPPSDRNGVAPSLQTETALLHSGLDEDGRFNDGTLFIGDSLTFGLVSYYLRPFDMLGQARYMAICGAPTEVFFSQRTLQPDVNILYSPEFEGLTYQQAVAQAGSGLTAVYLMLGTNYRSTADADLYIRIADYLLAQCPHATVYLQLIPYSRSENVDYRQVNANIRSAFEHFQQEENLRVQLVDTFSAIGSEFLTGDGVHLTADGLDAWYNAIYAHKTHNKIPT